jgi:uncharacterized SAM-binding protein YcdF (DUF218 family)
VDDKASEKNFQRPNDKAFGGLLRRRQCLLPTWRGFTVLVLVLAAVTTFCVLTIHPFLAHNDPLPGGALVVEGWSPDYALESAVVEFRHRQYTKLYVTGGPLEIGAPLSEYKTYAERGAAILLKLGLAPQDLQAVPAPLVVRDRTFASAVALRQWLRDHGSAAGQINLITVGPHARRSRLMYQKAMGADTLVGVIPVLSRDYDPNHWWRSSEGVRTVISEALAYAYARFLFRPA